MTQSHWADFEEWYNYTRDTEERDIYALASLWSRVVPAVNIRLLQVCVCAGMAEWFCRVPRGCSGNPGRKLNWGVVQCHLLTAGCWSARWNKTGGRRTVAGSREVSDMVSFTVCLSHLHLDQIGSPNPLWAEVRHFSFFVTSKTRSQLAADIE